MSKLPDLKGRISYIASPDRQENLFAVYDTADTEFWTCLARESRQEFGRFGTEGKCIEARELIIALPENFTQYDPDEVLKEFTEKFKGQYGVECTSALHYNKTKTNYHIHLIFSERRLLETPDNKIATRAVYFDETGKRVRTKKEITGEDGTIRKGCIHIYSEYLAAFLNTQYGIQEIRRRARQSINQTNVNPEEVKAIEIPLLKREFQENARRCYEKAHQLRKDASKKYDEAEAFFARKMDMDYFKLKDYSNAIKLLSASFKTFGRLDAEYYQPKYEAIVKKLNTRETVLSLCNLHDKNYNPDAKQTYQYIELADVGQSGDISDVDIQYGSDLPTRARRIVKSGQVIVPSVEGSLQSCALITDEYDGVLCSTGFYVLDSDCINSETLLVLFKSEPIQALMKQRCSGTILTAISKDELLSMPLPMIDDDIQEEIAAKVQESFALRKQSKQLLEYAKQAVEMAIEQGEDVAMEWLKDKVN